MSSPAHVTEAQFEANRANAQHSTGPRTPHGKSRTRLNGLRHGLTSQTVVMPHEDRGIYNQHCAAMLADLKPEGPLESQLAQSIADDQWRLNRARAVEENIYALGIAASGPPEIQVSYDMRAAFVQAQSFLDHAQQLQLLTLYESRIHRNMQRNLALLKQLQAERKEAYDKALEEAQLLAQLALSKGETYRPEENGFGFSPSEINRLIDRNNRLNEARALLKAGQSPLPNTKRTGR